MLNSNAERVKRLTGIGIWLFIIARVLLGFGAGPVERGVIFLKLQGVGLLH